MLQRFISLFFISIIILSFKALAEESPVKSSDFKDDIILYESNSSGTNIYVDQGDTLWSISFNLRLDLKVTMSQMMLAIFNENSNAFEGNINALKKNSILSIPFAKQVININSEFAFDEVQRQHEEWTTIEKNNSSIKSSLPNEPLEEGNVIRDFDATLVFEDKLQIQSKKSDDEPVNFLDEIDNYDHEIGEPAAKISPKIMPKKESKSDLLINDETHAGNSEINSKVIVNQDDDSQPKNIINSNGKSSIDTTNSDSGSIEEKISKRTELVIIWTIILFILVVLFGVSRFMRKDSSNDQSAQDSKLPQKNSEKTKSQAKGFDLSSNGTVSIVSTKLDLARAYVDMGDLVKALSILEDVLDEGNELQRREAKSLLKNISK